MAVRHSLIRLSFPILFWTGAWAQQFTISTVAGTGTSGFAGDSGPAKSAQLNLPGSVIVDSSGKIYIADGGNHRIRMISGGTISTIAGNGTAGFSGDGAAATAAELNDPTGIALDSSGNLYIADAENNVIRKVSGGNISTIAGNNTAGYSGDGGTAITGQLNGPVALAVDSSGNVFIADSFNNAIREVTTDGNIHTIVGGASYHSAVEPSGWPGDRCQGRALHRGYGQPPYIEVRNFKKGFHTHCRQRHTWNFGRRWASRSRRTRRSDGSGGGFRRQCLYCGYPQQPDP